MNIFYNYAHGTTSKKFVEELLQKQPEGNLHGKKITKGAKKAKEKKRISRIAQLHYAKVCLPKLEEQKQQELIDKLAQIKTKPVYFKRVQRIKNFLLYLEFSTDEELAKSITENTKKPALSEETTYPPAAPPTDKLTPPSKPTTTQAPAQVPTPRELDRELKDWEKGPIDNIIKRAGSEEFYKQWKLTQAREGLQLIDALPQSMKQTHPFLLLKHTYDNHHDAIDFMRKKNHISLPTIARAALQYKGITLNYDDTSVWELYEAALKYRLKRLGTKTETRPHPLITTEHHLAWLIQEIGEDNAKEFIQGDKDLERLFPAAKKLITLFTKTKSENAAPLREVKQADPSRETKQAQDKTTAFPLPSSSPPDWMGSEKQMKNEDRVKLLKGIDTLADPKFYKKFFTARISEYNRLSGEMRDILRSSHPFVVAIELLTKQPTSLKKMKQWKAHVNAVTAAKLGLEGVVVANREESGTYGDTSNWKIFTATARAQLKELHKVSPLTTTDIEWFQAKVGNTIAQKIATSDTITKEQLEHLELICGNSLGLKAGDRVTSELRKKIVSEAGAQAWEEFASIQDVAFQKILPKSIE